MLDPQAADLVDSVARLCVLRTEDYALLQTVHRRAQGYGHPQEEEGSRQHPPYSTPERVGDASQSRKTEDTTNGANTKAYIRYLTEEVRVREECRLTEQIKWLEAVRQWAVHFQERKVMPRQANGLSETSDESISLAVPAIWLFWENKGDVAFQRLYAAAVQQVYGLDSTDLDSGPFAHLEVCKCLYGRGGAAAGDLIKSFTFQAQRVHSFFFLSSQRTALSGSPSHILDELHPVELDSWPMASERRSRLLASHHTWLVFFFLWCHIVASSVTASRGGATATGGVEAMWLRCESIFLSPARDFLTNQGQLLRTLLTSMRDDNVCVK
ncbi:hypothetical protein JKF63_01184 [Porcisia hertigi]|uniref:Uncharacterized protein n=1 Tax=Porcisia hertigi TaxID=2761500 RepID=A0A836L337_9TRYP|nr:hypothetical protein JKF63_01184 [Porcisia hertigi]